MSKDHDRFSFSAAVTCGSSPLFWHRNTHGFMWIDVVFHRGDPAACRRFCLPRHHDVFFALARRILPSRSETSLELVCFLHFRGWVVDRRGSVIIVLGPSAEQSNPSVRGEGGRLLRSLPHGELPPQRSAVGLKSRCRA